MKFLRLYLLGASVILGACSPSLTKHSHAQPAFDLFAYFAGETQAWGMVKDIRGNQIDRFKVDIVGTLLDENTLQLVESFVYQNGDLQERIWTIKRTSDRTFVGVADDVIGDAVAELEGNTIRWQYVFRLETEKGKVDLKVDDWMFLQDEKHLFSISKMKAFGITVSTVHIFFQQKSPLRDLLEQASLQAQIDYPKPQLVSGNRSRSLIHASRQLVHSLGLHQHNNKSKRNIYEF